MNGFEPVSAKCTCGRKLPRVDGLPHATIVCRRYCKCGKRWQVILSLLREKAGVKIWKANLTLLETKGGK